MFYNIFTLYNLILCYIAVYFNIFSLLYYTAIDFIALHYIILHYTRSYYVLFSSLLFYGIM